MANEKNFLIILVGPNLCVCVCVCVHIKCAKFC